MDNARGEFTRPSSNTGFTLVELLVYSVLMIVVLLIVGGFLISSLRAQNTVGNATQASNTGQLVSRSVGHGVRNAISLSHSPGGSGVPEVLLARTMRSDGTLICQAWSFDGDEVRTTSSTGPISTAVTSWTLLGDGMQVNTTTGATTLFTKVNEDQVNLNLKALVAGSEPVLVQTSAVSRQPISTGVPCFP